MHVVADAFGDQSGGSLITDSQKQKHMSTCVRPPACAFSKASGYTAGAILQVIVRTVQRTRKFWPVVIMCDLLAFSQHVWRHAPPALPIRPSF